MLDHLESPASGRAVLYITIPAKQLPLAQAIRDFGTATGSTNVTTPLADLLEPVLRVLVELSYDRTTSYGQPTRFGLVPKVDPAELRAQLADAASAGARAALADISASATEAASKAARATTAGWSARASVVTAAHAAGRATATANTAGAVADVASCPDPPMKRPASLATVIRDGRQRHRTASPSARRVGGVLKSVGASTRRARLATGPGNPGKRSDAVRDHHA